MNQSVLQAHDIIQWSLEKERNLTSSNNFTQDNWVTKPECPKIPQDSNEVETVLESFKKYYIPAIVIVGVIGNLLIGAVFFFTPLRKRTSSYLLLSRAVVDTCFLVNMLISYQFGYLPAAKTRLHLDCRIQNYIHNVSSSLSIWYTVGYTVERYIAVQYPTLLTSVRTPSRTRIAIVILTLAFAALNIYIFFMFNQVCNCHIFPKYMNLLNSFLKIEVVLCFMGPFFAILIMNILIVRSLFRLDSIPFEGDGSEESKSTLYLGRSQRSVNGTTNDVLKCQTLICESPEQLQLCTVVATKDRHDQLIECKQYSSALPNARLLPTSAKLSPMGIDNIPYIDDPQTPVHERPKLRNSSDSDQSNFLREVCCRQENGPNAEILKVNEAIDKEVDLIGGGIESGVPSWENESHFSDEGNSQKNLSEEITSRVIEKFGNLEPSSDVVMPFNRVDEIPSNLDNLSFYHANAETFAQLPKSSSVRTFFSTSEIAIASGATSTTTLTSPKITRAAETEALVGTEQPEQPSQITPSLRDHNQIPNSDQREAAPERRNPVFAMERTKSGCFFSPVSKPTNKVNERNVKGNQRCSKRYSSTTIMLVVASSVFLILHSPSIFLRTYCSFSMPNIPHKTATILMFLMDIFDHIDFLHYAINFFLYCFSGTTFRNHTRVLLMKWR